MIKSATTRFKYLSMSKPFARIKVIFKMTTAKDMEITVITVLLLFLPRFAIAMRRMDAPFSPFLLFFFVPAPSV